MTKNIRFIARLDVKGENLIKGIQLEGLRKLGKPNDFARKYYSEGIDEIIYMDIVASLYERNSLLNIIEEATKDIFIPITVGGGIRSIENVQEALHAGADKVAINTAAVKRPELITEISRRFGSQCAVLSIEAKKTGDNKWEVYYDNGREKTGMDVLDWAKRGYSLGAGEILLTSVDKEGTGKGMDVELIDKVASSVPIPVIASGGIGSLSDIENAVTSKHVDAIAMAHVLHYDKLKLSEIHGWAKSRSDLDVRCVDDIKI
jgi:cyclase